MAGRGKHEGLWWWRWLLGAGNLHKVLQEQDPLRDALFVARRKEGQAVMELSTFYKPSALFC